MYLNINNYLYFLPFISNQQFVPIFYKMTSLTSSLKKPRRNSLLQKMIVLSEKEVIPDTEWNQVKISSNIISRRSCHSSCLHDDKLYIYGGYDNNSSGIFDDMFQYSFTDKSWKNIPIKGDSPGKRHSHSSILYKNQIYMFGGMVGLINNTNSLHKFNIETQEWKIVKTKNPPKAIDSHRVCLYQNQMIVGFGYSENEYTSNILSLNLDTLQWTNLHDMKQEKSNQYPEARSLNSFNIQGNTIYIYGGKNFDKMFNDMWKFDIPSRKFQRMEENNLEVRYGHSGIISQDKLFVFGGTKGVTYQRNDLISICLKTGQQKTYWLDTQQQINNRLSFQLRKTQSISRTNTMIKRTQSIKKQNVEKDIEKAAGKYRTQLKDVDYYNEIYENKQYDDLMNKKFKKNPLLTEIENNNQQIDVPLVLNATFQMLTNSILFMNNKSSSKVEKSQKAEQTKKKIPNARDNYTADLYIGTSPQLVIFGGGMHKVSYNDLIMIDLKKIKVVQEFIFP